ncbi:hypothetical protein DH09_02645 [Bacillaceae bacterium JMAK1]|nr:hypothetical protein DH09_02645 [Bacillaceae bacterium JMAK1]
MKPTVIVTRSQEDVGTDPLMRVLHHKGVDAVHIPLVMQRPLHVDVASIELERYDWIIFTSANAVRYFYEHYKAARVPSSVKIATVGQKTSAAAKRYDYPVFINPDQRFTAESLYEMLEPRVKYGDRVLIPNSKQSRDLLQTKLTELGAVVDVHAFYETVPNADLTRDQLSMLNNPIYPLVFTSPSAVKAYNAFSREKTNSKRQAFVIGPITKREARHCEFKQLIAPSEYTFQHLAEAIYQYL